MTKSEMIRELEDIRGRKSELAIHRDFHMVVKCLLEVIRTCPAGWQEADDEC